jgi:protein TonB
LARFYPDRAQRLEKEGRAMIECQVAVNGTLVGCHVVSEDPPDMGFGDATLRISKYFKMRPQTKDGTPVAGGTVRIPLVWKLPR